MPALYCLEEASWRRGPNNKGSALPVLAAAQCLGFEVHRQAVRDGEEFFLALDNWAENPADQKILYLSFHGISGAITIGAEDIPIARIAQFLNGRGAGCHAHFSSCDTFSVSAGAIQRFLRQSGFDSASGFTSAIHIRDAIAFDILLMDYLLSEPGASNPNRALSAIQGAVPDLCRSLGLQFAIANRNYKRRASNAVSSLVVPWS